MERSLFTCAKQCSVAPHALRLMGWSVWRIGKSISVLGIQWLGALPASSLPFLPKRVQPLVVAGAARAAEARVVLAGAQASVDYQFTVGQLWLVHTVSRDGWAPVTIFRQRKIHDVRQKKRQ